MERVHDGPYGDGLISQFKKQDKPRITPDEIKEIVARAEHVTA